jgi:glycogen synthase
MRIVHVLHRSVPATIGYAIRSREIVTKQRELGLEPVVVTSPSQAPLGLLDGEGSEYIDGVRYFRSCSGLLPPTKNLGDASQLRSAARVVQNVLLFKMLRRVVKAYRPDVIHAHSPFTCGLIGIAVGRRAHIPTVYEVRGIWEETHAIRHGTEQGALRYRIVRFLENRALKRADFCIVIGDSLRSEVISRGVPAARIEVVPNGVDTEALRPSPPDAEVVRRLKLSGKTVFGYVGSFSAYEGLEILIHALEALAPQYPDLRLLLVGDGDLMPTLRRTAEERGVSDRVVFTGRVPFHEIPAYYSIFTFIVLPRQETRVTQTVTPLKPLEVMAAGKPLIASAIEGHREMVREGHNGLLFAPADVQDLVSKCEYLLRHKESAYDLSIRGRHWVEAERDWRSVIRRYLPVYERITGGGLRRH